MKMNKISGVYKIANTVTGEFYIGSSVDVKKRWRQHKQLNTWNKRPDSKLYQDMHKYGVDKFEFRILIATDPEYIREAEQNCIEVLNPSYNLVNAKGCDRKKVLKKYRQSDKGMESQKRYRHSEKNKICQKKYNGQLCTYCGEVLTLKALSGGLSRKGISSPTQEAHKYLINKGENK